MGDPAKAEPAKILDFPYLRGAGAKQYRNCQFFTPETARSTHFFWDYLHDYDLQDANIALSLYHSMVAEEREGG